LGAEIDPAHILDLDLRAIRVGADDDFRELFRVFEQALRADVELAFLACGRGFRTDRARRRLRVLLLDRIGHVIRRHAQHRELFGIEPDAHRVILRGEVLHIAHAGHALDLIDEVDVGIVAEKHAVIGALGRGQANG